MIVEARVTATNKGGLSVDVNGIRGFMPLSQVDMYRVEQSEQFVNQRLRCQVTEVKPEERNLVVSRRAVLERERDEQREKFWDGLAVGQMRSGMVRSILPFGAFVDLGGADGLIPIGELSWTRVNSPEEVVKVGQKVEVKVIKLDRPAHKIGLSLRQTTTSPWDTIEQRVYPGLVVTRKITRLMEFGAFVELEPGIEGLVHVSEISHQRIRKPSAVVQAGQEVNVKVLSIDKENRRVSLSMKQAVAAPEAEPEPEAAVEEAPVEKPKPRNIKLRGGVGNNWQLPEIGDE
jgi:small subunit ribosomal protein S1